jgi:hypothetical protein
MFRKLYWVTEQVKPDGSSRVTGVFTSIPNLVKEGLACNELGCLRLTLTKLDSENGPIGSWSAPNFGGIKETLADCVRSDDFSADQCESLVAALTDEKAGV